MLLKLAGRNQSFSLYHARQIAALVKAWYTLRNAHVVPELLDIQTNDRFA